MDVNNNVLETHDCGSVGPGQNLGTFNYNVPPNGHKAQYTVTTTGTATAAIPFEWAVYLYCCTSTNLVTQPCCPPDPLIQITLNNILGLEQTIYQLLQNLPTSALPRLPLYTDSTVHSGLSGTGTITLQTKAIAFRVDVTSDLTGWPHNVQVPTYYFSMGFVTSYAITSPIKGWRLVYQTQDFPLSAECDQIGYTLPAGITVNITELLEAPGA